jgi:hypothetical protein
MVKIAMYSGPRNLFSCTPANWAPMTLARVLTMRMTAMGRSMFFLKASQTRAASGRFSWMRAMSVRDRLRRQASESEQRKEPLMEMTMIRMSGSMSVPPRKYENDSL